MSGEVCEYLDQRYTDEANELYREICGELSKLSITTRRLVAGDLSILLFVASINPAAKVDNVSDMAHEIMRKKVRPRFRCMPTFGSSAELSACAHLAVQLRNLREGMEQTA